MARRTTTRTSTRSRPPFPSDAGRALRPTEADALAAWAALVGADAEQVTRVREPEPAADHYAPIARQFRPGPRPTLELSPVEAHARPDDVWLDIGAGGGRFAIPLSRRVARVVAVEPSAGMRATLSAAAAEAGRSNIEVHDSRWPDARWTESADVSLAAHSLYDIREIGPFLDAMEAHSRRLCIAVFGDQSRGAHLARLFEAVHGEAIATLPALREFVALLGARGRRLDVVTVEAEPAGGVVPLDEAAALAGRLLWLTPGSPKERRMRVLLEEWWAAPGGIALPPARRHVGVVSWRPPSR